jgi:cytochrome c-type biogenesis protein CcmH/NrfG
MSAYSEYIDAYFNRTLSKEEVNKFEQKLLEDKSFAEEVAFYLSAKQILKEQLAEEKKDWFKQLLKEKNSVADGRGHVRIKKIRTYRLVAAAAILILLFSSLYLFYLKPASSEQRAENYIRQNLSTLPVTMGTRLDSLEQGLRLYNEGQLDASRKIFEAIVQTDTSNYSAKKYLGIVYLRLANYDKALLYFQQLENYSLYSNPAIFYQALTLMKRNQPGDKPKAKLLLQQVVDNNLEEKETAERWLKKW